MHPQRSTKLLAFRGEPNFGAQITAHFFSSIFLGAMTEKRPRT